MNLRSSESNPSQNKTDMEQSKEEPDQEARRMDVEATKERGGGTSTWELRNDASETAAERKKKTRANY